MQPTQICASGHRRRSRIADYLAKAFREVGYVADLAGDGEEDWRWPNPANTTCWWSTACCETRWLSLIAPCAKGHGLRC